MSSPPSLQAQWLQIKLGQSWTSKNLILKQKVLKLKMEIFIFWWKQDNNLKKFWLTWDLNKWRQTDMCNLHSGILMHCFNLRLILLEMHMILSSCQSQNKLELMKKSTNKKSRKFMKKEVMEVKDTTMNGILNKQRKICWELTQLQFLLEYYRKSQNKFLSDQENSSLLIEFLETRL